MQSSLLPHHSEMRFLLLTALVAALAGITAGGANPDSYVNFLGENVVGGVEPSPTPSISPLATVSPSSDPSSDPTQMATPSGTPSMPMTAASTPSPSGTMPVTPTRSGTQSATRTITSTVTRTPSSTVSSGLTPTATQTGTMTGTPSVTRTGFRTPLPTRSASRNPEVSVSPTKTASSSKAAEASFSATATPVLAQPSAAPTIDAAQIEAYKEVTFDFQIPNVSVEDVTKPSVVEGVKESFSVLLNVPKENVVINGYTVVEVASRRRRRARLLQLNTAVQFQVGVRTTPTTPAAANISSVLQTALADPTAALSTVINVIAVETGVNPSDLTPIIGNIAVEQLATPTPVPENLEDAEFTRRLKLGFGIAGGIVLFGIAIFLGKKAMDSAKAASAGGAAAAGAPAGAAQMGAKGGAETQGATATAAVQGPGAGKKIVVQQGLEQYKSTRVPSRVPSRRNSATKLALGPTTVQRTEV